MGGETSVQPDPSNTELPKAFRHLRVNSKWGIESSGSNVQNLTDLWQRDSDVTGVSTGGRRVRKAVKKTSASALSRMEPYPQDFLSSIEKLSFHSEDCRLKSCKCSELRLKSKKPFNYANLIQHRPIIREAKLKLHHSEKDTKQLIRAARLKIFKRGKHSESKRTKPNLTLAGTTSPKIDSRVPVNVFGAKTGDKRESQDFQSLVPAQKSEDDDNPVTSDTCESYKFQEYRTHGGKRRREQNVESNKLRISYSDCRQEMRQSEGARLDDTNVDELAGYFDDFVYIPKKMSSMAEMMYA